MSSRARRYNGEKKKLNLKKVFAVIIALAVIIMVIIGLLAIMITGRKGRYEDLYDQDENETVRF